MNREVMEKKEKILPFLYLIDALLLILCVFKMPYGYYQFVRFTACVSFAFIAYSNYEIHNRNRAIFLLILSIMFQPFVPLAFGRAIWVIIDIVVAVYLIYMFVCTRTDK